MAYQELILTRPLFHYTTVEAFKSIAKTGSLRFSRADQTNDPFEVIYVRDVIKGILIELQKDLNYNRQIFWKKILNAYLEVSRPDRFYIACFSVRMDSVPMWRLYCDEGKGVVFGFRPRAVSAFDCRLTKIRYLRPGGGIVDHVRSITSKAAHERLDTKADTEHIPLAVRLVEATLSTKKIDWDYEQEIRLSFSFNTEKYKSIEEFVDPEMHSRLSSYEPTQFVQSPDRQYIFQPFGKRNGGLVDRSSAISQLFLGPNCDWNEMDAKDFLRKAGYTNFAIVKSEVVWR